MKEMEKIKGYTDLEQSLYLAEILPLDSADMEYLFLKEDNSQVAIVPFVKDSFEVENSAFEFTYYRIACWSLAALLKVLPYPSLHKTFIGWRCNSYTNEGTSCKMGDLRDNPVDACYVLILKLHELKCM